MRCECPYLCRNDGDGGDGVLPTKEDPLTRTAGDEAPDELHESTSFKRTMRKITMIKGSNSEHPMEYKNNANAIPYKVTG